MLFQRKFGMCLIQGTWYLDKYSNNFSSSFTNLLITVQIVNMRGLRIYVENY
jgi:hypothetical protein